MANKMSACLATKSPHPSLKHPPDRGSGVRRHFRVPGETSSLVRAFRIRRIQCLSDHVPVSSVPLATSAGTRVPTRRERHLADRLTPLGVHGGRCLGSPVPFRRPPRSVGPTGCLAPPGTRHG